MGECSGVWKQVVRRTVLGSLMLLVCTGSPMAFGQSPLPADNSGGGAALAAAERDPWSLVFTVNSLTGSLPVWIPAFTTLRANIETANTFDGRLLGNGVFEKTGAGKFTFSSISNANTFDFGGTVRMTSGTLEFKGGSATNALTLGSLQLTGGTLLLDASYLNVHTLNITGNTILDFGNGAGSVLNAQNIYIAAGVTLTVKNWTSEVDFLFANSSFRQNDGTGTSANFNAIGAAPENQIVFAGSSTAAGSGPTAWINYNYGGYTNFEIRPIPEPSTYGLTMMGGCIGFLAWRRHRKRRTPAGQTSSP